MADKRLSDVIRQEVLRDGDGAYVAFRDLASVQAKYPKVYDAIEREADLRPTMGGPTGVLEKLVRPFIDAELAKARKETTLVDEDVAAGVQDAHDQIADLKRRVSALETQKATPPQS